MGPEDLIGSAAQSISGIIKGITGGIQIHKGRKLLSGLKYPDEQIPDEITNAAAVGLPSEQYNLAMKNIQRQQLSALRGSQDRRGGLAVLPGITAATDNATLGLDAENAKARQQNQFRLASWKDKVWQNNIKDKYNRDYNYGMGLVGVGNQNLMGGLDQYLGASATGANQASSFGNGGIRMPSNNSVHNLAGGY